MPNLSFVHLSILLMMQHGTRSPGVGQSVGRNGFVFLCYLLDGWSFITLYVIHAGAWDG